MNFVNISVFSLFYHKMLKVIFVWPLLLFIFSLNITSWEQELWSPGRKDTRKDGQCIQPVHLLTHLLQTDTHITAFFITKIQQRTIPVPRKIIPQERAKCHNCIFRLHKCRYGKDNCHICAWQHFTT